MTAVSLSVVLPPFYLARDVFIVAERDGWRWHLRAVDSVGNSWPITFDGWTDTTSYKTKSFAVGKLESLGGRIGQRLFAVPAVRF